MVVVMTDDDDEAATDDHQHFQSSESLCRSEELRELRLCHGKREG